MTANKTPDPLRELLEAVLDAIDVPLNAEDYERQLVERAGLALTVARAALKEKPSDIAWNVDYLRASLKRPVCQRCRNPFDFKDHRFDGRSRYEDSPWCRSCVSNCHEGGAEHVCVVCDPARYGGEQP